MTRTLVVVGAVWVACGAAVAGMFAAARAHPPTPPAPPRPSPLRERLVGLALLAVLVLASAVYRRADRVRAWAIVRRANRRLRARPTTSCVRTPYLTRDDVLFVHVALDNRPTNDLAAWRAVATIEPVQ